MQVIQHTIRHKHDVEYIMSPKGCQYRLLCPWLS